MKKAKKIIISIVIALVVLIGLSVCFYLYSLTPVGDSEDTVTFVVNSGDSKTQIVANLKEANLIKNKYSALVYILLSGSSNIQAGNYELNRGMSTKEIITALANGDIVDSQKESVRITFKEGLTLEDCLELLAENTDLEYDTIIEEINDTEYLNTLIADYWFLTDEILDSDIYYGLEGYLYPETYDFYIDTTLDSAIRKMLNVTDARLSEVKDEIDSSDYSVHEILTMASIVEKEAVYEDDRAYVAQVIYKRLELNWNLGMDVTTYYGVGKDMSEVLMAVDLSDENPYNTRVATFKGLPVGPICNPSISSINAVLNPADTDYTYFFADVTTGKIYFTNDYEEFLDFKELYG